MNFWGNSENDLQVSRYIIVTFSQTASSSQSFCTLIPWDRGSVPQPSLVMLINTLNWPSIKTRFNTLVDTQTTLSRYLSQESTNFDRLIVGQHSANYQLTVDQTSVTVSIEGRPSISLDVHQVLFEMSIKGINWGNRLPLESRCD